ncbi:MAG: choice-of-anchor J domain-containing protein [Paludibacter sp.]|nr:choice-of-anchor J domain-containing protein [Paludibacter sp.]
MTREKNTKFLILYLTIFFSLYFLEIQGKTIELKITTLNTAWLSCSTYGPEDDELQINNIVTLISAIQPDIIALQEVGTSSVYATMDTLVKRLGDGWGGNMLPTYNDNCGQNLGIIYKKTRVEFVNSTLLNSGISSQGNSYYYNWSSGRYPVLYNVNVVDGATRIPLSIINIHAKAMSDETSYTRRKGASEGLKYILDGSAFNTKNIVLMGDFNDYLNGSQCGSCGDSPYKNFMDDTENYLGLTSGLNNPYYNNPVIDHIMISNELFGNLVQNSAVLETGATSIIPGYRYTTSDHTPISAVLSFQVEDSGSGDCENIVYSETFGSNLGGFTPYSVSGSQTWHWRAIYGAYISGYASGVNYENEGWLISPAFNLTGMQSATLTFDHALNFAPSESDKTANHTLWVTSNYQTGDPNTATWTQVPISVMASGNSWTFINSGNIAMPQQYMTDDVRFAFKYLSTSTTAATWEIRNLRFNAACVTSNNRTETASKSTVHGTNKLIKVTVNQLSPVSVYDIMGSCIFSGIISDDIDIPVPQSGIYLVRIGNISYKILVKE